MKLNRFQDAKEFFNRTQEFLLEKEFIHSLLLRISTRLKDNSQIYSKYPPYLATVEKENNILAVALRTPPFNLIISEVHNLATLEIIAKDIYQNEGEISGISGLTKETETFAQIWQNLTGQSYEISMHLRIHKLEKVQPIDKAKGHLRFANASDRPLLLVWTEQFYREAAGSIPVNINNEVDRYLKEKTVYFWQNNHKLVAFINASQITGNCVNIGPVYTPPEYRRKGYATSMVAELSKMLLNRGFKYCLLFTDLANPTSNHIYRKIGYQPVSDWNEYSFKTEPL